MKKKRENPKRITLLTKLIDDKSRECTGSSCTQRQIKFESSAATNAENRPYLSLKYFMPAPKTAKLASPLDGTQSARRFRLKASMGSGRHRRHLPVPQGRQRSLRGSSARNSSRKPTAKPSPNGRWR